MYITILWDVMPSSLVGINRLIGKRYSLHLQCRKLSQRSKQASSKQTTLLGWLFDPEEGGSTLFRKVSILSTRLHFQKIMFLKKHNFASWFRSVCILIPRPMERYIYIEDISEAKYCLAESWIRMAAKTGGRALQVAHTVQWRELPPASSTQPDN
jgi:hypothetical protein